MKNVDANLYIVGKGPLEQELREQAEDYQERIFFLGPKTHEELPEIYASADLFVAPSITAKDGDQEGFGLVIIEAMASGTPVVASRSGGIVDIIEDGQNGLLAEEKASIELAEKINLVLNNQELCEKLKQEGMKTAEQYDYKQIAKKYRNIIEKQIDNR